MNTVTRSNRDTFLRTKTKFYQCGWLDAERNEPAQASTREKDEPMYAQYLEGYNNSMDNSFTTENK